MAKHSERKARRDEERQALRGSRFRAAHRFARQSATKVRLVADQIRGLPINRALDALKYSKKRGARLLDKVVRSALANAEYAISEQKLDFSTDDLWVTEVEASEGPALKRWMTRARGMAYPILKKTCHIYVTLAPKGAEPGTGEAPEQKAEKREEAAAAAR